MSKGEIQGEPHRFQSSPPVERTLCPVCGTSLTYQHEERNHQIDITTGSLDNPEAYPPTKDFFCRDRLSWVEPTTDDLKE